MMIHYRLKSLVVPGEGQFFSLVGRSGKDDTDDGNESVNLAHIAHSAKARYGGRFDMMHSPRSAPGNHLPHIWVVPGFRRLRVAQQYVSGGFVSRNTSFQIKFETAPIKHPFHVAHCHQTALPQ